jgi:transcriptional regulator with XRE-family HTH domain
VINICTIVHSYIKGNFINQGKLASEIGTTSQNLSNRLKGKTMDTTMLYNISIALKHDFFQYFSKDVSRVIAAELKNMSYILEEQSTKYLMNENIDLYRKLEKEREDNERLKKGDKSTTKSKLKTNIKSTS